MALSAITLQNYRNFTSNHFRFSQLTAVIGANGVGKSNLIESIRLVSVGKPFKTNRFDELISFDQKSFFITAEFTEEKISPLEFFYGQAFPESPLKERKLTVRGKSRDWPSFWGEFPSVLFTVEDIGIITGSPAERRRFLDGIIWQIDKEFRFQLLELGRVLRERAALLFLIKTNRASLSELRPWNELLLGLSRAVRQKRQACLTKLAQAIEQLGGQLKSQRKFVFEYRFSQSDIEAKIKEEISLAQNLFGPQRDELIITANDASARRFSSRGQARSLILLLKLAEMGLIGAQLKKSVVLLLDDIFAELDSKTLKDFFSLLKNDNQIILTGIEDNALLKGYQKIELNGNAR